MISFSRLTAFIFQSYSCYLYKNTLIKSNEANFLPKIGNISFEVITSETQLDGLIAAGFHMPSMDKETRSMLRKGAMAGFLFVNKELASLEWVATNQQANAAINMYPLRIDYSKKQAYASGVWTKPKFRGKGLHTYVYYRIYDFLRENGISTVLSIVATDNLAAQRAHDKFAPHEKIYAQARYLRILGVNFWKETPLSQRTPVRTFGYSPSMSASRKPGTIDDNKYRV